MMLKGRFSPGFRAISLIHIFSDTIGRNFIKKSQVKRMFNNRGQFYLSGETSALKWEWWWATLESNQACVSARELQSPATPCGLSPNKGLIKREVGGRQP